MVGGLVGYIKKRSMASLAGGVGTGLLLVFAGFLSLKAFDKRKNSYLALVIETGTMNTFFFLFLFCFSVCVFSRYKFYTLLAFSLLVIEPWCDSLLELYG